MNFEEYTSGRSPRIGFQKSIPDLIEKTTDLEQLLIDLNITFPKLYSNNRVLDVYYSRIRGQIKKVHGSEAHKMSLELLKIPVDSKIKIIKEAHQKVHLKNENLAEISLTWVRRLVEKYIDDEDIYKLVLIVCICSGCRPIEVLGMSDFSMCPDNYICQDGVAKSRVHKTIEKPIIFISSKIFIDKVHLIRKYLEADGKISSYDSAKLQEAASFVFEGRYNFYCSRKFYALISYDLKKRSGNFPSYVNWISTVLGHSTLETANNYSHYYLTY